MKVVINACFGGFGLSEAACERLIELGVPRVPFINQRYNEKTRKYEPPHPSQSGRVLIDYEHPETDWAGDTKGKEMHDRWHATSMRHRFDASWFRKDENRADPALVQVVEELGAKASGEVAKLKVVEIPDGIEWCIDDYDGRESIAETHRSWS